MKKWHYVMGFLFLIIMPMTFRILFRVGLIPVNETTYQIANMLSNLTMIALVTLTIVYGLRVAVRPKWLTFLLAFLNLLPFAPWLVFAFLVTRKPVVKPIVFESNNSITTEKAP